MNILFAIVFAITATKAYVDKATNAVHVSTIAAVDAKRDKTDLTVYEIQDDVGGAYLPPECLPAATTAWWASSPARTSLPADSPSDLSASS
jgi:hypothetical protein